MMLSLTVPILALAPPVLRFTDCKTGRAIVLIGVMHGNPTSVALTQAALRECHADADGLGAVALELCPQRWDRTARAPPPPPGSLRAWLRADEVQAAVDLAEEFGCGLAAVDQARCTVHPHSALHQCAPSASHMDSHLGCPLAGDRRHVRAARAAEQAGVGATRHARRPAGYISTVAECTSTPLSCGAKAGGRGTVL